MLLEKNVPKCHDLTGSNVAQADSCEILRTVERELELVNSIEQE
jgi:hypothetical protein